MIKVTLVGRFILLWLLCPLIALASFRFLFGGVALTMPDFLYHAELRPVAFYAHITLASVALFLVPLQLWPGFRRRRLALHRLLGRVYGFSVVAAGTGGFMMAVMTESGPVAAWGFALLALAWVSTTVCGIVRAMQHDLQSHQRWMIRSAGLTMSAVTLRLYLGTGVAVGLSYPEIVGFLAWGCWVPNLIVAEIIIGKVWQKRLPIPFTRSAA